MDQLPDDMVVQIFSHVETDALLVSVRAVCRRWAELAVHQDAWRHRGCGDELSGEATVARVLRLAPCLRSLSLSQSAVMDAVGAVALTTACSVEELRLDVGVSDLILQILGDEGATLDQLQRLNSRQALTCLRIVRNLASRGALRRLFLSMAADEVQRHRGIFVTLKDLDLDELHVQFMDTSACIVYTENPRFDELFAMTPPGAGERRWGGGSLRSLSYKTQLVIEPFLLEFFLTARAASLESVHLAGVHPMFECWTTLMTALARCKNLKALTAPATQELTRLQDCSELASLRVYFPFADGEEHGVHQLPAPFFVQATQLRELAFASATPYCPAEGAIAMDMVKALASSGDSALEKLSLELDASILHRLSSYLPCFPKLRVVELVGFAPTADFLDALAVAAMPSLRLLAVQSASASECVFSEVRANAGEYEDLVQKNPDVHVDILCRGQSHSDCLHRVGFYGHPPEDACDMHSDKHVSWVAL